jgi:3-hydroxymyristoyl/3-hydroxydecanoyl-(acyl carrier protein) dehydratase
LLPHGEGFRFVDEVTERVPLERIQALKTFPAGEPFAAAWPWVPEVLLLEALVQISGMLVVPEDHETDQPEVIKGFLAAVPHLEFLRPVPKGVPVTLRSVLGMRLGSAIRCDVSAAVNGADVVVGRITMGGMVPA